MSARAHFAFQHQSGEHDLFYWLCKIYLLFILVQYWSIKSNQATKRWSFYELATDKYFQFISVSVFFHLLPLLFTFSHQRCVCAHKCNSRPHGRIPGASEWHATDTQQEHSAHFPTAARPKQGAKTRQEWRERLSVTAWRCQSRAGKPKIAVITWSAADTHCDVCACTRLCVSFHKPSDRRVSQEGNGCKPQERYNDSGRKMQHGIA